MGIPAAVTGVGGWTVGPVVGRRPAGVARDAVHPGTGARGVLVIVDGRFTGRGLPDPETVARAAIVGSPAVMPMLDAGLLEDGTRWYVTPAAPGPVLDPAAGCSPRRAATIVEAVARALAAVHAAGLVHGLIGPDAVVPALGRHSERPVSQTLLLDTGVAALLGDRTDDLAAASGVSLPADRGPAADVHALGALLLRLVTAAAPAGPALAALPVPLRALLSRMLDEHPSRRPSADAVADGLAGMREGLLATGPIEMPRSAPAPLRSAPAPVPRPAEAAATPAPVPAPVPAPHTTESPIVVPRSSPAPAPSLWTGPITVRLPGRPGRRRVQRFLLLAGGVGVAGMLVGVLTHLPLGHQDEEQAVAAAGNSGFAAPATQSASGSTSASASGTTAPSASAASTSPRSGAVALTATAPAFVQPVSVLPSPLAAAATSPTPSRTTTAPATHSGSATTTTSPSTSTSASGSTGSAPVASSEPSAPTASTGSAGSSGSSAPTDSAPPVSSTPTDTGSPADPSTSEPAPSDTPTSDATTGDPSSSSTD